jgi:hypothetical protein
MNRKKNQMKETQNKNVNKIISYFVLAGAHEQIDERLPHVFGKSGGEHVLVCTKLMSRLTHYRINDIESGHFILWLTL